VKTKLRILLLEDNNADVELIAHELKSSGLDFQLERIQSETDLRREIERANPDLILSDHGLPSFDGFRALEIVRNINPELPFIFVSGSNNQGMVSRMHEEGATDYVFKKDLHDLSPAVREALKPRSSLAVEVQRARPAPVAVASTQLWLCPSCLHARDEHGVTVNFLEYFRRHKEIVVRHELCDACPPI
jgi:CheY-like chemotaxis protein